MPEYFENEILKTWVKEFITTNPLLLKALDYTPSADVEPVRHGYWGEYTLWMVVCSLCGKHTAKKNNFKYCPNCGAKMDEENSE